MCAPKPFVATDVTIAKTMPLRLRSSASTSLQMTPARRDEDRGVRVEGIPVRHPRDVIGHGALGAVALGDPLVLGRQEVRVLLEMLEQFPEHALSLAVLGLCRTREIDVLEHELAEGVGRLEDLVAHRHIRLAI